MGGTTIRKPLRAGFGSLLPPMSDHSGEGVPDLPTRTRFAPSRRGEALLLEARPCRTH